MELLETVISQIIPQDREYRTRARERLEQLVMPMWALGDLMDLAVELAAMTRSMRPPVDRRTVAVFAADHGVTRSDVSQYPTEVTCQMVHAMASGKACINALAQAANAQVVVVDAGVAGDLSSLMRQERIISKRVEAGTEDMSCGPAMTREQAIRALEAGIEVAQALHPSTDLYAIGEMGIGNPTAASAIIAAVSEMPVASGTGSGSGISEERFAHKVRVIERALDVNRPDPEDGLDVLSKVGGFEIGAIAGFVLGAAAQQKPVVLDGFPATAGAVIAQLLAPSSADYMIAGHRSVERGHDLMHDRLGKQPLLDLRMRLGEGTGAVLALPVVAASARLLWHVATFDEIGVSGANS